MPVSQHLVDLAASGDIGTLVNGLSPDWGPFGKLGTTGRTVIQVLMAGVVLVLLGRAILGAVHMKIGEGQQDYGQVSKGKKEVSGSLVGVFVVASLGTIFTIVYGMGI
ncbi:hypothetical protein PV387_10440 [Streptomyces sp. ME02-6987-2C]|uniref:hypothetical protein n=1 Tax=unclassified Streptomyces TaxID=2593676 RepID=UPI00087AC9C4|nr:MULTISPECIES: hypothetical protein [unclassified Streptomyces]MDX3366445.1 hypothetical protein [Streptomyces sp. ME02-6987-2C]MDX3423732.1 hypothetical protein [Streptomyces sp. ME02-6985-2c]REH20630.1 hypothetical protein BX268_2414 [Streptomyces sp. 2221.1]SDT30735.1 hypothetical protein SAMN05428941_2409 [Streptomyces sp. 2114.2]